MAPVRASASRKRPSRRRRPIPLRTGPVMSRNSRWPASTMKLGPASRSRGGQPATVATAEPIRWKAWSPIGVSGRKTPWATLNEK